jgi:hypothetical protein
VSPPPPMRPATTCKAIGLGVASALWCIGWLVYDLFIAPMHGWGRVVFPLIFGLLLAWNLWQIPRSLRSYKRLRASSPRPRRAAGQADDHAGAPGLPAGRDPAGGLAMLMGDAPIENVLAVMAEHRPRRHFYN